MQSVVLFSKTDIPRTHLFIVFLWKTWLSSSDLKSRVLSNNHLNGIFIPFDSLNSKISPGFRLIDNFPSHFSFYQANCKDKEIKIAHLCKLDDIFSNTSLDPKSVVVILNASIRNNITISISYIHSSLNNVRKAIHYAVNVTSTEAKLFAIRYSINQAIQIPEATYIIIIMNAIYTAEHIFNFTIHPYQLQSIGIAKNLRLFFLKHSTNFIKFWNYPSKDN